LVFVCNGLHPVLPSAVVGLAGRMFMVSISNISSSLSTCTPSLTLITKKEFDPLSLTTYHIQHTAFSCFTYATLDNTMIPYSLGYSSSHPLQSHLTQQVLLSHVYQPTHCASPFRHINNLLHVGPQKSSQFPLLRLPSTFMHGSSNKAKIYHSLPITITH